MLSRYNRPVIGIALGLMLATGVLYAQSAAPPPATPPAVDAPEPATAPPGAPPSPAARPTPAPVPPPRTIPPYVAVEPELPEQARAPQQTFESLPRFGAALFAGAQTAAEATAEQPASNQPVPDSYLLGPGDRLSLRVWAKNFEQIAQDVVVSPEGFAILPQVGRLAASGNTLEQLRSQLQEAYSRLFTEPQVTLTVAEQRVVEVFVTGEAVRPGRYSLAGMATVLNALYAAGGPSDIGSFRRIALQRVGQPTVTIDLYDYLLTGSRDTDQVLRPGDTVFIPTSGGEVGLTGAVRRPGRYELTEGVTLARAIELAGGLKPSAYAPMVHLWRQDQSARWTLSAADISRPDSPDLARSLQDGDLVIIKSILDTGANTVQLRGAVKRPGTYPVTPETTVSSLLRQAEGLLWNAHMGTGVVHRMDADRHFFVVPFDVREQMYGQSPTPIPLEPKDEVEIYSQEDVEPAKVVEVQGAVAKPGAYEWAGDLRVSQLIMLAGGLVPEAYTRRADLLRLTPDQSYEVIAVDLAAALRADPAADLTVKRGDVLRVSHRSEATPPSEVQAAGFVRLPGAYPRREGMKVSDLIFAAGGLKPGAGPEVLLIRGRFEGAPEQQKLSLTGGPDDYRVEPDSLLQDDDSVAVLGRGGFKQDADLVAVQGRVKSPGSYPLARDENQSYTVYDLLQQAGGLLPEGNAAGIVVYRKREYYVGLAQSEDLNRILASVNREAAGQTAGTLGSDQQAGAMNTAVSENLRQVLSGSGTAAIILPPRPVRPEDWVAAIPVSGRKLLESKGAEGNVELEPGDTVVVPRQTNTVMILGAVPRSGAVPFVADRTVQYYTNESGGLREDAASDRMVVVHANGAAAPIRMGDRLEAGDIIVVPTKHIIRTIRTESAWTQWARGLVSLIAAALVF